MFAKTYGATTLGIDGVLIEVEADVANGLPKFEIVGLADVAVKEAKERVRPAIRNTNVNLVPKKVTINLAPADLRKKWLIFGLTDSYSTFGSIWDFYLRIVVVIVY